MRAEKVARVRSNRRRVRVCAFVSGKHELLEMQNYNVMHMTDSQAALKLFRKNPDVIDLVITDQTMPGLTGDELAKAMLAIKPQLRIILCTGHSEYVDADVAESIGIDGFLMKPVKADVLLEEVSNLLNARRD